MSISNEDLRGRVIARAMKIVTLEPELKGLLPLNEVIKRTADPSLKTIQLLEIICKGYKDRIALSSASSRDTPSFDLHLSYGSLWRSIQELATGMSVSGVARRGDVVAMCGFTSRDYVIADLASLYLGTLAVPLPLNVTKADLVSILLESEARVVLCSVDELDTVLGVMPQCPNLHTLVLMDVHARGSDSDGDVSSSSVEEEAKVKAMEAVQRLVPLPPTITTLRSLMERGAGWAEGPIAPAVPGKDGYETSPTHALIYTSGSTGTPKGAMYDDRLLSHYFRRGKVHLPLVTLAYLPMSHIMGRVAIYTSLAQGGMVNFVRRSDLSSFVEDLSAVRPTTLILVPRVTHMLFDHHHARLATEVDKLGPQPQPQALQAVEERLRVETRDVVLGGRLLSITCGSAATAPQVVEFLQSVCEVAVQDVYGSTELGADVLTDGTTPSNVTNAKLVDVEELGYTTRDKPYPRGELCIKSKTCIKGYYKQPEAMGALVDEDGWYHTGDIMERRGDKYHYIDRRSNVIKLSQGEFVSLSRLETLLTAHPSIHQAFVHGTSQRSYVVAVLVPSHSLLASARTGNDKGNKDDVDMGLLRQQLRGAIEQVAKDHDLKGFEVPREVYVELEPFSRSNNLLTDSNKLARRNLKDRYGSVLEGMYVEVEAAKERNMAAVKEAYANNNSNNNMSTEDKVRAAVEAVLGVSLSSLDETTFVQQGGDSLAAVRLTDTLADICGIRLPAETVLNPANTLASLVQTIDAAAQNGGTVAAAEEVLVAFENLHGTRDEVDVVKASQLDLRKVIDPELLTWDPNPIADPAASSSCCMPWAFSSGRGNKGRAGESLLVTGANGYLGRFLLLDLLQRLDGNPRAQVVCIVRARDDAAARRRLEEALGKPGTGPRDELDKRAHMVHVLAGDVGMERLGLSQDTYDRLCTEIDTVIHAGALVNHTMPYMQLFGPNVLGTVHVMRFCLEGRRKPLNFVSTIGVALGKNTRKAVTEDQLGVDLMSERRTTKLYAAGYSCTKWVSEVLLQQLHQRTNLPINVFRCSLVLPHTDPRFAQLNASDVFTRLLAGLIYTGIAPASFASDPFMASSAFNGLPVDVVARCINGVSLAAASKGHGSGSGCDLYHVVDPQLRGSPTLDDMVDWIHEAGYTIRKIEGHDAWFESFKRRLEALPPAKKRQSPLVLVHEWEHSKPKPGEAQHATSVGSARFVAAARALGGYSYSVPRVGRSYLDAVLQRMVEAAIIDPPAAAVAAQTN